MQMVIHQLVAGVATNTILHNAPDAAKYDRHWEHVLSSIKRKQLSKYQNIQIFKSAHTENLELKSKLS